MHGHIIERCVAVHLWNSSRCSVLLAHFAFIISIILAFSSAHAFGLSLFVPSCCTVASVGKQTYPMHVPAKPFHFSEINGCLRLQYFRTCVVNSTCVVLSEHICVPPFICLPLAIIKRCLLPMDIIPVDCWKGRMTSWRAFAHCFLIIASTQLVCGHSWVPWIGWVLG